jgi:Ca-activated chloride channel family protein
MPAGAPATERARSVSGRAFAAGPAISLLIVVTALGLAAHSQSPPTTSRLFQTRVDLVSVTATVTDRDGHLVTGLTSDAFDIYEDGERQAITQFTSERVPIGLGALVDISDSMFGKRIAEAKAAVDQFLLELLTPADEFFILAFNHRPHVLTGWTRESAVVRRALDGLRPSGGTAAYDAIVEALPLAAERARERTALLVISDGADTASNATLRDLRTALLRSNVFVYAIGIDPPDRQAINTRVNATALREITAESGGRTEIVQSSADIAAATASIADELNHQYVLGYTSSRAADGKFHSIRVRLTRADARVRARNGYVAAPHS